VLELFLELGPGLTETGTAPGRRERPAGEVEPVARKIAHQTGGFGGGLDDGDQLGRAVAGLGRFDHGGIPDLAVGGDRVDDGGTDRGAVWLLFLRSDGSVGKKRKISALAGGFTGPLSDGDRFGSALASFEDLDGDGLRDLAVGATGDDDGAANAGATWILFLDADGGVANHAKLSATTPALAGLLAQNDAFGSALAVLDDLDGDGVPELAIGAPGDDDGASDAGAVWLFLLNPDGSIKAQARISALAGGFPGALDTGDASGARSPRSTISTATACRSSRSAPRATTTASRTPGQPGSSS
jgi:hypothetical protein